jgi:hypothetical protein
MIKINAWARRERDLYRKQLADARAGKFRISEDDGSGNWKDTTQEHIARLAAAIASLDEILAEDEVKDQEGG